MSSNDMSAIMNQDSNRFLACSFPSPTLSYCSVGGRVLQAAFWYGLIVHFRIYPIIYAIPFVIVLGKNYTAPAGSPVLTHWGWKQHFQHDKASENGLATHWNLRSSLITRDTILFGFFSGSMIFAWTGVFSYLYGWDFLNEALLYHLTRAVPRHNFSIYFYHIYLHHQQGFSSIQKEARSVLNLNNNLNNLYVLFT